MIQTNSSNLSESDNHRLKTWLSQPEFELLLNHISGQVAKDCAQAWNSNMAKPMDRILSGEPSVGALLQSQKAAEWQIVLNKLHELSKSDYVFESIALTHQSNA